MHVKKKMAIVLSSAMVAASLVGCAGSGSQESGSTADSSQATTSTTTGTAEVETTTEAAETFADALADELAGRTTWSTISLKDDNCNSSDTTVKVKENKVTIKAAGYYKVSGVLSEGQLMVKAEEDDAVVICLDGVTLTCPDEAAIKVKSAGSVTIYTAEGTDNVITSGAEKAIDGSEVPAMIGDKKASGGAVNSTCDLTICGKGTLQVNGYVKMGIHSQKNLTVSSGVIDVRAIGNGIKSNGDLTVMDGRVTVLAGNDALKAGDEEATAEGNIYIKGGTVTGFGLGDGMAATGKRVVDGGCVIAVGNGEKSKRFAKASQQANLHTDIAVKQGDRITFTDASGQLLAETEALCAGQHVAFSHEKLNGSDTGIVEAGTNTVTVPLGE